MSAKGQFQFRGIKGGCAGFILSALVLSSSPLRAETLGEMLKGYLEEDNTVKAAQSGIKASKERYRAAMGGWYPNFSMTAFAGREDQNKPEADDTSLTTKEMDLSITQRLWDGGLTSSIVRTARLSLAQSRASLDVARVDALLKGVQAYVLLQKAVTVLDFSRRSVAKIEELKKIEEKKIELEAGSVTELNQIKVQLAEAKSVRIAADGELKRSLNIFRSIYHREPTNLNDMRTPSMPVHLLPTSVEEAVQIAKENHPILRREAYTPRIAAQAVKAARASGFTPSFDAVAEIKYKKDVSGTIGFQRETLGKVQMTFPFNLGFTAVNTLKASKGDLSATETTYAETVLQYELQIRNAWDALRTAQDTVELRLLQAENAKEFKESALKEKDAEGGSMVTVVIGEKQVLDALSAAAAANLDVVSAFYILLGGMGLLNEEMLMDLEAGTTPAQNAEMAPQAG